MSDAGQFDEFRAGFRAVLACHFDWQALIPIAVYDNGRDMGGASADGSVVA